MKSSSIVEDLDVIEDGVASRVSGIEHDSIDKFFFDGSKETLGNGVIPAVAFATHAGLEAVDFESELVVGASILAAAVCVVN